MNINKANLCIKLLLEDNPHQFPGPQLSIAKHREKAVSNTQLVKDVALTILQEIASPEAKCSEDSIINLRKQLLLYCRKHDTSLDRNTSVKTITLLHLLIIKKFKESKKTFITPKWEPTTNAAESATGKELFDALFTLFYDFSTLPTSKLETSSLPSEIFTYFVPLVDSLIQECPAPLIPQMQKDKLHLLHRIQLAEQMITLERELIKVSDIEKTDLSKRCRKLLLEKQSSKITEADLLLLKDTSFSLDAEVNLICRLKQQLEILLSACQILQKRVLDHTTWSHHKTSKEKIYISPPRDTEMITEVGLYIRTSTALEKLVNTGKAKTEAAVKLLKDITAYQKEVDSEKSKLFCDKLIDFYILNSKLTEYSHNSPEIERYFSASLHTDLTPNTSVSFPSSKRLQFLKQLWNATNSTALSMFYDNTKGSNITLQTDQLKFYLRILLIIQKDAVTKEQQALFHTLHSRLVSFIKSPHLDKEIKKTSYYALTDPSIPKVYDHIFSILKLPVDISSYEAIRAKLHDTLLESEKKGVLEDRENKFEFLPPKKTHKTKKGRSAAKKVGLEQRPFLPSEIKIDLLATKTAALSITKNQEATSGQTKESMTRSIKKKSPLKLHPRTACWFAAKGSRLIHL